MSVDRMCWQVYIFFVHVLICVSGLTSTNFCLGVSFPLLVKVYQVSVDEVAPMKVKFWINQLNYLGFSSFTGSNKLSRLFVKLWPSRHGPSRWNGTTTFRVSLPTSAQSRPSLTDLSEVYLLRDSRSCEINTTEHHSANIGTSTCVSYASLLESNLILCVSFLTRWPNTSNKQLPRTRMFLTLFQKCRSMFAWPCCFRSVIAWYIRVKTCGTRGYFYDPVGRQRRKSKRLEPQNLFRDTAANPSTRPHVPVAGTNFQPAVLWETVRLLILPKVRGKWLWWVWDSYFLQFLTFLFVFFLKSRVLALEAQITRWQKTLRWGCGYTNLEMFSVLLVVVT